MNSIISSNKSIIRQHLNNKQKVFVDLYEQHVLLQVTLDNIDLIKVVDISDNSLDDDTYESTQQEKKEYFSQDFDSSNLLSKFWNDTHDKHVDEMRLMLNTLSVSKIYHIDCDADVYIVD